MRNVINFVAKHLSKSKAQKFYLWIDNTVGALGAVMSRFFPAKARKILSDEFTLVNRGENRNLIDIVIRAGLARRAMREKRFEDIEEYHRRFWQGRKGAAYHDLRETAFSTLPHFGDLFGEIDVVLEKHRAFSTVIEIGSGNGQSLEYMANRFPKVDKFVGIDLNEETIQKCRSAYTSPKFEWIAADCDGWIRNEARPNSVFVSHGALEYIPQKKLESLLSVMAAELKPLLMIVIEPISAIHNLEEDPNSIVYGREYSFSHNYPRILRDAGFSIRYRKRADAEGIPDWMGIAASAGVD